MSSEYTNVQEAYGFDEVRERAGLNTVKWEYEIRLANSPDLLSFGTADMDFRSAPAIVDRLKQAVELGHFGYPDRPDSYYDAIVGYMLRHFGWTIDRSWIQGGIGIYSSMYHIVSEMSGVGDEIVYQSPVHHIFPLLISDNDRTPLVNPLMERDGRYTMDLEALERSITPRTKLLLLCNPHNPNGRVWTRAELQALAEVCEKHGIFVVADEVYSGLLYPGATFTPFASVSEWASMNTFTLVSASKSFNLTGLKHSAVIAENPELRAVYERGLRKANLNYGGSTFGIAALETAFRDCDDWSLAVMDYVAANHAYLVSEFAAHLPSVKITSPEAAYFAWIDLRPLGLDRAVYEDAIYRHARLVVTYGEPMGEGGQGFIRVNLGTPRAILEAGLNRLFPALQEAMSSAKDG